MNKAESKTLFNLKLLAVSIILLVVLSLLFISQKNKNDQTSRFAEPATKNIKTLAKKYNLIDLNISDEVFVSEIKANNYTYINYWAHWCEPCKEEIPALINLQKQNPDLRLVFVNIDSSEKSELAKSFWKQLNLNQKSYYMPNKKVYSYSVALPYHQIFDRNKKFVAHFFGEIIGQEKDLIKLLSELN